MPKQRRSIKSSRGRRQAKQSCATTGRPSTRRSQRVTHDSPSSTVEAPSDTGTHLLTASDILVIVQQVTTTLSGANQPPLAKYTLTTTLQMTGTEEENPAPLSTSLTLADIPSLVDAVVSLLASNRTGNSSVQPGIVFSYMLNCSCISLLYSQ